MEKKNNQTSLSFGRYLKTIRLEKGIDLKSVSDETRIGVDILLLLEEESHDQLPAEVFVKGFLRAYAKTVGADGDEAVRRYTSVRTIFKKAEDDVVELDKRDRFFWPRFVFISCILACIIVASVFLLSYFSGAGHKKNLTGKVPVEKHKLRTSPENLRQTKLKTPAEPPVPVVIPQKLLLNIKAVENTWMKIIADGQIPKECSLKPGDILEMEASKNFNLLIGNAAGVQLTLNGKPVKVSGKSGDVVNIQIPEKQTSLHSTDDNSRT